MKKIIAFVAYAVLMLMFFRGLYLNLRKESAKAEQRGERISSPATSAGVGSSASASGRIVTNEIIVTHTLSPKVYVNEGELLDHHQETGWYEVIVNGTVTNSYLPGERKAISVPAEYIQWKLADTDPATSRRVTYWKWRSH